MPQERGPGDTKHQGLSFQGEGPMLTSRQKKVWASLRWRAKHRERWREYMRGGAIGHANERQANKGKPSQQSRRAMFQNRRPCRSAPTVTPSPWIIVGAVEPGQPPQSKPGPTPQAYTRASPLGTNWVKADVSARSQQSRRGVYRRLRLSAPNEKMPMLSLGLSNRVM